ncbi:1884_t:CDS:2, partial [Ambispora leptoticha]
MTQKCIEKNFLLTKENKCLISDCDKTVDPVISEQRFSESSQFSETSAIADMLGNNLGLDSPMYTSPLLGQKEHEESVDKSNKRQKITTEEGESSTVKKLIKELKDDSVNKDLIFASQLSEDGYTYLYKEIVKAEAEMILQVKRFKKGPIPQIGAY